MASDDPLKAALKGASMEIAGAAAAETPDLFGLPVDDPSGEIEKARATGLKGGRPKGAQNVATRELREYLLARGMLPQQAIMQWFMLGPVGLANALKCDLADAFDRWERMGDRLGRYFMAPMTPVDGEGKPAPSFAVFIDGRSGVVAGDGSTLPPWEYLRQQNQELSDIEGERSQDEEKDA